MDLSVTLSRGRSSSRPCRPATIQFAPNNLSGTGRRLRHGRLGVSRAVLNHHLSARMKVDRDSALLIHASARTIYISQSDVDLGDPPGKPPQRILKPSLDKLLERAVDAHIPTRVVNIHSVPPLDGMGKGVP